MYNKSPFTVIFCHHVFFLTETPVCQSWSTKGDHITQEQGFRTGAKAFSSTDPCGKKKKILA